MKICLNRATAGAGLPLEQFCAVAADAGFPGADVDLAYGAQHGSDALRDLYASKNLAFGGWGPNVDWRGDEAKLNDGLPTLDLPRAPHALSYCWLNRQGVWDLYTPRGFGRSPK